MFAWSIFLFFALLSVVSALMVVIKRNPLHSAMWLVLTLFCTAVIYVFLQAHFIAAIQILLYAGAIMVLFVFVIMLISQTEADQRLSWVGLGRYSGIATVAGLFFLVVISLAGYSIDYETVVDLGESFGGVHAVATTFIRDYFWAFETTSVLLLVAIVGAVVLTQGGRILQRKDRP